MLRNYKPSHIETVVEYGLRFFQHEDGGFEFPCDAQGNLLPMTGEAKANYTWAMQHPEHFPWGYNEVHRYDRQYREPASGDCDCGEHVDLYDEYYGACQCPKCGKWYNLFGQELLPPDEWESDPSEDEYYPEGWY